MGTSISVVGGRAVSLLLLLAFGACNSVSPFAGKWEGKRSLDFVPNADPSIQHTATRVELTVSPDGRFTLVDRSLPLEGQIEPDGTVKIEQMNGRPAEVKAPAKLSRTGETLRLEFEGSIELRQMSPK